MRFGGDVNSHESGLGIKDLLLSKREEILRIAPRHGARNVHVFASVARGEAVSYQSCAGGAILQ